MSSWSETTKSVPRNEEPENQDRVLDTQGLLKVVGSEDLPVWSDPREDLFSGFGWVRWIFTSGDKMLWFFTRVN